jgi:hypothetical protein
MNTPTETPQAIAWHFSEMRCNHCLRIPSGGYIPLAIQLQPGLDLWKVNCLLVCRDCGKSNCQVLNDEDELKSIVDRYKADWLDV